MRPHPSTLFCLLLLTCFSSLLAQPVLPVSEVGQLPPSSSWLTGPPSQIKGKQAAMEAVLDLAQPSLRDSIIEKKQQRHVIAVGLFMQKVLGLYWEILQPGKQKYIGSSSREMQFFDGVAKEMDINLFIMPHLPKYIGLVHNVYKTTLVRNQGNSNQFRIDNPPYPSPEELRFENEGYFTVECEVTPPEEFRKEFEEKVMPLEPGLNELAGHPNFGEKYPSFGMMGALCLDCNHNCRPEIHPIEWLWWLDLAAEGSGKPEDWQWLLSLLHDGTERFEDWSASPIEGQISIPFRVAKGVSNYEITLEALVVGGSIPIQSQVPVLAQPLKEGRQQFLLGTGGPQLTVLTKAPNGSEQLNWWIEGLQRERQSGDIFGYIRIAAAAREMFSARVSAGPR
jgi:hypothetical protein